MLNNVIDREPPEAFIYHPLAMLWGGGGKVKTLCLWGRGQVLLSLRPPPLLTPFKAILYHLLK